MIRSMCLVVLAAVAAAILAAVEGGILPPGIAPMEAELTATPAPIRRQDARLCTRRDARRYAKHIHPYGSFFVARFSSREAEKRVTYPLPRIEREIKVQLSALIRPGPVRGVTASVGLIDQVAAAAPKLCMDTTHANRGGHWWNGGLPENA